MSTLQVIDETLYYAKLRLLFSVFTLWGAIVGVEGSNVPSVSSCSHHTCLSCAPLLAQGWLRSEVKWKWSLAIGCWRTTTFPDWVAIAEEWWDWDCYTRSVRGSLDPGEEYNRLGWHLNLTWSLKSDSNCIQAILWHRELLCSRKQLVLAVLHPKISPHSIFTLNVKRYGSNYLERSSE